MSLSLMLLIDTIGEMAKETFLKRALILEDGVDPPGCFCGFYGLQPRHKNVDLFHYLYRTYFPKGFFGVE